MNLFGMELFPRLDSGDILPDPEPVAIPTPKAPRAPRPKRAPRQRNRANEKPRHRSMAEQLRIRYPKLTPAERKKKWAEYHRNYYREHLSLAARSRKAA